MQLTYTTDCVNTTIPKSGHDDNLVIGARQ
jgi:hypothetical protein